MTKQFVLGTFLGLGLLAGAAIADDKADAQKKVDAAKVDACEKVKKYIADQHAKGYCKDEHAAAQKLTCGPATFKDATDLNSKCMKSSVKDQKDAKNAKDAKPADKPADTKDAKPNPDAKPAAGGTKCRGMIDGKMVVEVDDASSVKCGTKLMEAMRAEKCVTDDMKGKKVEYTVNHDHLVAKKPMKDRVTSLTCFKIVKK